MILLSINNFTFHCEPYLLVSTDENVYYRFNTLVSNASVNTKCGDNRNMRLQYRTVHWGRWTNYTHVYILYER